MTVSTNVGPSPHVVSLSSGLRLRWSVVLTGVLFGAGMLTALPGVASAIDGPVQTTVPFAGVGVGLSALAVDANGNAYGADFAKDKVLELPAGATSASQQITL